MPCNKSASPTLGGIVTNAISLRALLGCDAEIFATDVAESRRISGDAEGFRIWSKTASVVRELDRLEPAQAAAALHVME